MKILEARNQPRDSGFHYKSMGARRTIKYFIILANFYVDCQWFHLRICMVIVWEVVLA